MGGFVIRQAQPADWPSCWAILQPVFEKGDSYPYRGDMDEMDARRLWLESPLRCYVAQDNGGEVLGTYYLKPNQAGRGDHVCNCGYVTAQAARGRGVASAMCRHSQQEALALGFSAMQFNLVVASNTGAVALWQKLGFEIIGTLPGAFRHDELGPVDAHIMFKTLA
ncbi:GNAT family N-acetyltransferase [Salaquimonas pukyongi]|uniref:GNAT family N-acetyltransferase n=1 Tax=Salaquimonas pukyongi TaxID=2712698 RepID=UPI001FCDE0FC|nr:GNAT family N-acetyltransferase [Salaquimonas pukyongi]